jgi:CubicO group peptidase (beta-lactamase class C family)
MPDKQTIIIQSPLVNVLLIILGAIAFLLLLFFLPINSSAVSNTSLEEFTAHLDQQVPILLNRYKIPGVSLALVKDGEVAWTGAYGFADLESGREMTPDTPCRVQSISKSVTAWGVLKLVEGEIIELDSPLETYLHSWQLPDTQFPEEQVTIRQLLNQTSGMPLGTIGVHYSPDETLPTLRENLSKEARLAGEPGDSYSYSNPGFNLLELLIEEVTGRDFAEYMKSEVLNPLGMHQASFNLQETWRDQVPLAYDSRGNGIPVYIYPEKAAGGLFASAEEIALFLSAGMISGNNPGGNVIESESLQLLYSPAAELTGYYSLVSETYGMGHFIETLASGETAVWHGGQGHGWMTHFHSVPERGDGIVILTNSQRSWPFFAHILQDWANWSGFSPPGMVLILKATRVVWGATAGLGLILIWQGFLLGAGLHSGSRNLDPFLPYNRLRRLAAAAGSAAILLYLVFELLRGYSFLASIFPAVYPWLVMVMILLAIELVLFSLFPENQAS